MLELFDNAFSPFARKVRMALGYKRIPYRAIDGLALDKQEYLFAVNPRREVPVLVDGPVRIVGSADIVAYLDDLCPLPALMPSTLRDRVIARSWQARADVALDAIVHDISIWHWPTHKRLDTPPSGLIEAGMADASRILAEFDGQLGESFACGALSIADLALFPHVSALRFLGLDVASFPRVHAWFNRMRAVPCVKEDLDYLKRSVAASFAQATHPYEPTKIVWRGDRIEWLFARGYFDWFVREWTEGRAIVPSG